MAKAKDLRKDRTSWDVAIYGASGSGKTTWAARSPDPFVILTEPQGLDSIVEVNPEADVEIVPTFERLSEILRELKKGRMEGTGAAARYVFKLDGIERRISTIVFDSFSDVQDLIIGWITEGQPSKMKIQDWGQLFVIGKKMLKDLRDLPPSKVVLFLASESTDDLQVRRTLPALRGGIADSIGQFFNVFGFARVSEVEGRREHVIDFRLSDRYISKAPRRWPNRIRSRLERPGDTTLGSLSLALLGPDTPHAPGDSASFVTLATIEDSSESEDTAVEAAPSTNNTRRPRKGAK